MWKRRRNRWTNNVIVYKSRSYSFLRPKLCSYVNITLYHDFLCILKNTFAIFHFHIKNRNNIFAVLGPTNRARMVFVALYFFLFYNWKIIIFYKLSFRYFASAHYIVEWKGLIYNVLNYRDQICYLLNNINKGKICHFLESFI